MGQCDKYVAQRGTVGKRTFPYRGAGHLHNAQLPRLAIGHRSLAENARAMAIVWVTLADVTVALLRLELFLPVTGRPTSAITLADTDGIRHTTADTSWTPVVPKPNHRVSGGPQVAPTQRGCGLKGYFAQAAFRSASEAR